MYATTIEQRTFKTVFSTSAVIVNPFEEHHTRISVKANWKGEPNQAMWAVLVLLHISCPLLLAFTSAAHSQVVNNNI